MNRMTLMVRVVEAVLAAVSLIVGWWIGTPILAVTRVDLHSGILALAATLPLVAYVFWSMRTEFAFLARLRNLVRETIVPLFANCSPWEILLISIMAGIGEELFFRGLLQGSLGRVVNPWIALALVSALFGLAHYVSLGYAIIAGLLGAYMGALVLLTGNLFVAMAVHALFDFAALLFISRAPIGGVIIAMPREAHPTGRFGTSTPDQESIQCPPVLTYPSSASWTPSTSRS